MSNDFVAILLAFLSGLGFAFGGEAGPLDPPDAEIGAGIEPGG